MAQSKGIIFYPEHIMVARGLLSEAELGQLLVALCDYSESGTNPEPAHSKAWRVCYDLMRGAIDKNAQRYAEKCECNRRNISKRWSSQASSNESIPTDTTVYGGIQSDTIATNITEPSLTEPSLTEPNRTERKDRAPRFTPPTVEDVATYCRERGNSVDPQAFVDHYTANGWRRGKTPIKDWHACVRTWERSSDTRRKEAASSFEDFGFERF